MQNTQIIILAAGRGTRMGGEAKGLTKLAGKPFLMHILDTLSTIPLAHTPIVVVGYEKDKVIKCIEGRCEHAEQKEQLGTGHAVLCAKSKAIKPHDTVVVLYTDHPLVSAQTIEKAIQKQKETGAPIVMTPTTLPDYADWRDSFLRWGRVKRNADGEIIGLVEYKDANEEERAILEVTPGYFAFDAKWLWENLEKLDNNNAQKEYYLTYLVNIAVQNGEKVESINIPPEQALGANTKEELAILEKFAV